MEKILLHTCCGPCSLGVIGELKTEYEITLFFYNPNIWPVEEYEKRIDAARKICKRLEINLVLGGYDHGKWKANVAGDEEEKEGGKRCEKCYEYRIRKTAGKAKEMGIRKIATTLTISPHKNSKIINDIGRKVAIEQGIEFIEKDFKKEDGLLKSVRLSKEIGIYRQNYCGCEFSIRSNMASPKLKKR